MWLDVRIHKEAIYFKAYLNGEFVKNCVAANEEEGWVEIYKTDSDGHVLLNNWRETETEKKFGKVEIKGPEKGF